MIETDFDFIFIDAGPQPAAVEQVWVEWSGWVRPGGVIALHERLVPDHDAAVVPLE